MGQYKIVTPGYLGGVCWVSISLIVLQGAIKTDYTEENISISNYPLSAALCCAKLCDAFEQSWGIF